jgi:hypothetical protein
MSSDLADSTDSTDSTDLETQQHHDVPGSGQHGKRLPPRAQRYVILAGIALLAVCIVAFPSTRHVARHVVHRVIDSLPLRLAVYSVWLVPLAELIMLLAGLAKYRFGFRSAPEKFRLLIMQVTTTGREMDRVNEVIAAIRAFQLSMPHEVWVVTEPGQADSYPLADRVLTVPESFTSRAHKKARALSYSAQFRQSLGLDTADVKIIYNDDDVQPTKSYIETAFAADYDICEGITAPRAFYGGRPFGHFLASHTDDMRTRGCLIYCSVFQGLLGKPLHVHGEGLTVTGECERVVSWEHPVVASEDLAFGHNAAHMGMRWGWFREYVELTSPWSFREFLIQRKRWYWGNVYAITHRDVLPLSRAIPVAVNGIFGVVTVIVSFTGVVLRYTGHLPPESPVLEVSKLAIATWLAIFAVCGWIDASSGIAGRDDDSRILSALAAVVMAPVSSLMTVVVLLVSLHQGDPRTFEVIRKTRN